MSEEKAELAEMDEFDELMGTTIIPTNSDQRLEEMQKLRYGLIRKHIKDTEDPKMLARVESLANGIDKQELTKQRMAQDKEEGAANREIAAEIFQSMVKAGLNPDVTIPKEALPEIDDSGIELLDDELIQGDDTANSVID